MTALNQKHLVELRGSLGVLSLLLGTAGLVPYIKGFKVDSVIIFLCWLLSLVALSVLWYAAFVLDSDAVTKG